MLEKRLSLLFIFALISGCQKEQTQINTTFPAAAPASSAVAGQDNFEDLKAKKDESCGTEKDAEKKIMEAAQKPMQLQGTTDSDCAVK
jgi:hypothetical protein